MLDNNQNKLTKELLSSILKEQFETFKSKDRGIQREVLKDLKDVVGSPQIMVITGLRRVGKSTDPVKVKLGHSANRFLTALSSERCLFDPYSTYSNPYLDPLKFHNPILMGFIQEVINDHPDVKSRRISQTDIGFCVASLYLSLAPHNHKIVALHSDSDIEILEEWFLKGYYRYLYGHFKEKELPEDLFYRIRSRLTHITPGRGRLTTIPVLALTRPAQKNTHYMLNARNA